MSAITDTIGLLNADVASMATKIAKAILDGGSGGWSTLVGQNVTSSIVHTDYGSAEELLNAGNLGQTLVTEVDWSGDHIGKMWFLVPANGAKGVIAHMMALMLGGEANPESTKLDAEGMDAYSEAVNSFFGQAAQQARGDVGGNIKLTVSPSRSVDFSTDKVTDTFPPDDLICQRANVVIPGLIPFQVFLLMTVSVTGMKIEQLKDKSSIMKEGASALGIDPKNLDNAMHLKVPVVVEIASKLVRMELIQDMCPGTIIEFRKMSGEMLDVMIGNVKIGEAEAVITNQHFGVQIRRIVDPQAVEPV